MIHTILIATRSFGSTSQKPWEILKEAGCQWVQADMHTEMTENRLIEALEGIDGTIVGVVPMTARVLEAAPRLKVVSAHGVGVDHIDVKAASRLEIVIANCPGTNDQAVADLTIGLMISVAREIPKVDRGLRAGEWGRYQGSELWRKTLGIVGLGHVGRGVARRALGFEMRVLACDPFVKQEEIGLPGVALVSLDEIIREADFISLHAPLNEVTRNMIGPEQFSKMKPEAYLINTARGGLADESALYQALTRKQIAGAALDVFSEEPPARSPLLGLENIVITPHIGAHSKEAIERVGITAAENVIRVLQGGEPHFRVS